MPPRTKSTESQDVQAAAADQIYEIARQDADSELARMRSDLDAVREESYAAGALKAIGANLAYNEFLQALTLIKIKAAKSYRAGGMNWVQFCSSIGVPDRTADRIIDEVGPVVEKFSANLADLSGYPLSKIRYLGKTISANLAEIDGDCIVYGDERVPLDDREGVQALIEQIEEGRRELEATVAAKDKVLEAKEKVLNRQERDLKRLSREAERKGLLPYEDAFLERLNELRTTFDGFMCQVDPDRMEELRDETEIPTPRMFTALVMTLEYMRDLTGIALTKAEELSGAPADEGEGWAPGKGAAVGGE